MSQHPLLYQLEGINFLSGRQVALLADDTGLGKSMQMIRAAMKSGVTRTLLFTPKVGLVSWRLQVEEWGPTPRPQVYRYPDETLHLIPDGPLVMLVTHDLLSNPKKAAGLALAMQGAVPFEAVMVDEAHAFKTPTATRTQVLYGPTLDRTSGLLRPALFRGALKHIWIATATPTPLHVGELYPHLCALFPGVLLTLFKGTLPTQEQFEDRFCQITTGAYGRQIAGNNPETIPALQNALAAHMLMRLKEDVLPQLPSVTTSILPLEVAQPSDIARATDPDNIGQLDDDDEFLNALQAAWLDPHYSTRRAYLGGLKANAIQPWIEDFLNTNRTRKLIVFAHHRDVIQTLVHRNETSFGAVAIYGGTKPADAADAVRRFQNDPDCRLFVGQNRAANTAITLTAGSTVLMLEPDPSPAMNYQAISRAHRLGQQDNVHAIFTTEDRNPIERRLVSILRRRSTDYAGLFGRSLPGSI